MSALAGRKITLWDTSGTAAMVAGGRDHGITINNELIDVTDKGSGGWRELLADVGIRSIDVSVSGLLNGSDIIGITMGSTSGMILAHELRIDGVGIFAGDWGVESPELSSAHDGPAEMNFTLKSSGEITWTPE